MDDALLLSRIQFAFVVSFHILFPALTIGLASWLAFLEGAWLRTREQRWLELYFFWLRIFAVSFGMGVVSGIVMSFQFGTNWAAFSERAGNVLGPLLSYEVLTAFFLEASFLGVMLFGFRRVPEKVHFASTVIVAVGTLISTFWIISANSWMHTPQGFELRDGVFHPASWFEIVFNPSFPTRLAHMVLAAYLTTAFVVGGVAAWQLLRGRHVEAARAQLKLAVIFAAITAPLQVVVGDLSGLVVAKHQPAKLAAMEGHWHSRGPMPLLLFAVPDAQAERNHLEIGIPKLGSLIVAHDLEAEIPGLAQFPRDQRPPVAPVFYAFRVMVGLGVLMVLLPWVSLLASRRGWLERRWLLRAWVTMGPSGFVAVLAGWFTAEIGRQPWVVYGLMRTAEARSDVPASSVLASLIVFGVVYAIVFGAGIAFLLKLVRKGPTAVAPHTDGGARTAARPLSVPEPTPEGVE